MSKLDPFFRRSGLPQRTSLAPGRHLDQTRQIGSTDLEWVIWAHSTALTSVAVRGNSIQTSKLIRILSKMATLILTLDARLPNGNTLITMGPMGILAEVYLSHL